MTDNPYREPSELIDTAPKQPGFSIFGLLVVIAIIAVLLAIYLPALRNSGTARHRTPCLNNIRNIALALHGYHTEYGSLPPAYTVDADGRPLHSWRTLILQYLDEPSLYDSIDLSKPWDDPVNAPALARIPAVYRCPSADIAETFTTYCGIVGAHNFFHPTESRRFFEFPDSLSDTLMLMEVSQSEAVPWMAPEDTNESFVLSISRQTDFAHPNVTVVAIADGSVRVMGTDLPESVRRGMLTIDGGEPPSKW